MIEHVLKATSGRQALSTHKSMHGREVIDGLVVGWNLITSGPNKEVANR